MASLSSRDATYAQPLASIPCHLRACNATCLAACLPAGAVGGTWRDHNFPNAGTDTEVPTYYPSFLPTPETSSQFGERDEILSYFKRVSKEQIGEDKFMWGTAIASAKFDGSMWELSDAVGSITLQCRFLMPCVYSISCKWPHVPAIPNRDLFAGDVQHSMQLGPEVRLLDRRRCESPPSCFPPSLLPSPLLSAAALTGRCPPLG